MTDPHADVASTPPLVPAESPLSRRALLLGTAGVLGGAALLAACGSDGEATGSTGSDASTGTGDTTAPSGSSDSQTPSEFVIVQRFPNMQAFVPGEVRLAVSLARSDGSLLVDGPDRLTGVVRNEAGEQIDTIDAVRRGTGLSVPYWSIVTNFPERGLYDMTIDGAIGDATPVLVFDADEITMPTIGSVLPGFDTPTTTDARDVDPICTRLDGACPFHDVTLTEALASGLPVVYLVGTPAHCTTATCGPGLDFLIDAATAYTGKVTFVHAEVYADPEGTTVAPAVDALTLQYEPVMFFTDATGTITNRVDIVWDAAELAELLAAAYG